MTISLLFWSIVLLATAVVLLMIGLFLVISNMVCLIIDSVRSWWADRKRKRGNR